MTENSSVTALMGSTIPNQKEPPLGGTISQQEKLFRNFTQLSCRIATKDWSVFQLQTSCVVTVLPDTNISSP